MELTEKQATRLIEIIKQYEIIYAGGISSSAASIRAECDNLIDIISGNGKQKIIKKTKPGVSASVQKIRKIETSKKTVKPKTDSKTKEKKPDREQKVIKKETKKKISAAHLFEAYQKNRLPEYGGYIVSSFFDIFPGYTKFEIVGFDNVQDIFIKGNSLVFKSSGCKLFCLIEPPNYSYQSIEPVLREPQISIPYRFEELFSIKTKRHQKIYIGKKPVISMSSFTIMKPKKDDFAILFYDVSSVFRNIQDFLYPILNDELRIPKREALKASSVIAEGIKGFQTWLDL